MTEQDEMIKIAVEGLQTYPDGPFADESRKKAFEGSRLALIWGELEFQRNQLHEASMRLADGLGRGNLDAVVGALCVADEYEMIVSEEVAAGILQSTDQS